MLLVARAAGTADGADSGSAVERAGEAQIDRAARATAAGAVIAGSVGSGLAVRAVRVDQSARRREACAADEDQTAAASAVAGDAVVALTGSATAAERDAIEQRVGQLRTADAAADDVLSAFGTARAVVPAVAGVTALATVATAATSGVVAVAAAAAVGFVAAALFGVSVAGGVDAFSTPSVVTSVVLRRRAGVVDRRIAVVCGRSAKAVSGDVDVAARSDRHRAGCKKGQYASARTVPRKRRDDAAARACPGADRHRAPLGYGDDLGRSGWVTVDQRVGEIDRGAGDRGDPGEFPLADRSGREVDRRLIRESRASPSVALEHHHEAAGGKGDRRITGAARPGTDRATRQRTVTG